MSNELNYQLPDSGYGSYLSNIIPAEQAIAAGAFSASMQQIKNISSVDNQQFAQVVFSNELTTDLPLVNGTNVPTNTDLADQAQLLLALGSGPNGTYTMSDFFGCMSALPYPIRDMYNEIKSLESTTLTQLYQQLYLAVKWEDAVLSYTLGNNSPSDYFIASISVVNPGNGYGRGNAPAPIISLPYGASATCTIGTDPNNLSTYGKVTSINLISGGSHSNNSGWFVNIECPPTSTLGGTNTVSGTIGWPTMNTPIQNYIDLSNAEISLIQTRYSNLATLLIANWNITGTMLKIEQRTRYNGISPVSVPKDNWLNVFPTPQNVFVDSIPSYAKDTFPHMTAQTLENISNLSLVGGQSLIAAMRQERNQARMSEIGIDIDNNIPDVLPEEQQQILIANGTVPLAVEGIPSADNNIYTIPAWSTNIPPVPVGYYDPNIQAIREVTQTTNGTIAPILQAAPIISVGTNSPQSIGPEFNPPMDVPVGVNMVFPIFPPELNTMYMTNTMSPATYDSTEAIDQVIHCNCDCWIQ